MQSAGVIRYRKMFGEYSIYCNEKVVALVCDNQLFVKPTKAGNSFIGEVVAKPPYSGAKPYFFIKDQIENIDWVSRLISITESELSVPKPKSKKKTTRKK
jgi:TfoX/Sxy family transcriptional regulator of competence genes